MPKGTTKAALAVIKQLPGSTPRDVFQLMEDSARPRKFENLSGTLTALYKSGQVTREPHETESGMATFKYKINPAYEPYIRRGHKLKTPTENGLKATCEELRTKLIEIQAWREDAIRRYPDLALTEVMKKARKIVAQRLRTRGDETGAKAVEAGHRDETALIQAVVDALESL